VAVSDTGQYECQVSGRNHTTSSKRINLNVIDTKTTIDGAGPDIFVSIGSSLVLTCRVYTAGISLNYLIWRRGDKIARFIGGENAGEELRSDSAGWFVSSLEVGTIQADSGDKYECSPSPGSSATANVHVITEGTMLTVHSGTDHKSSLNSLALALALRVSLIALPSCQHWDSTVKIFGF